MGFASFALPPIDLDVVLRRKLAGKVRGGQGFLRGQLSEAEAARNHLRGLRESRGQTADARVADFGGGDPRTNRNALRRAAASQGVRSVGMRRHATGMSPQRGTGKRRGNVRQGRLPADALEYVDRAFSVGNSVVLALGDWAARPANARI